MRKLALNLFLMVHGGIRHLEKPFHGTFARLCVHGGIRHLEMIIAVACHTDCVHGGIRHLENRYTLSIC